MQGKIRVDRGRGVAGAEELDGGGIAEGGDGAVARDIAAVEDQGGAGVGRGGREVQGIRAECEGGAGMEGDGRGAEIAAAG